MMLDVKNLAANFAARFCAAVNLAYYFWFFKKISGNSRLFNCRDENAKAYK